jgi:hypothetical protein
LRLVSERPSLISSVESLPVPNSLLLDEPPTVSRLWAVPVCCTCRGRMRKAM